MRVYHFLNAEHGLSDISCRRLKVADLLTLNDPFEMLPACAVEDRPAFHNTKAALAQKNGILCFCRSWQNPVHWSHYADKHHGMSLGFDIPDDRLEAIKYSDCRPWFIAREHVEKTQEQRLRWMRTLLFTKYSHWQYEGEQRVWVRLSDCIEETFEGMTLHFKEFHDDLTLKEVIIGIRSCVTAETVRTALSSLKDSVEVFKAVTSDTQYLVEKKPT